MIWRYQNSQNWVSQFIRGKLEVVRMPVFVFVFAFAMLPAALAQNYRVLHRFTGGANGAYPSSNVVYSGVGDFYGTTEDGGIIGGECDEGCGTVFKISTDGKFSVMYRFLGGTDGSSPMGNLLLDRDGTLLGTTAYGGFLGGVCFPGGCGTVFRLDMSGKHTVLHDFRGSDGSTPSPGVILEAQGYLYGITSGGGDPKCACGVVFKLDKTGKETVLYRFSGLRSGEFPTYLIRDADRNFYGTTMIGGVSERYCENGNDACGTVFELDTSGKETVLYSFGEKPNDGEFPNGLVRDSKGNLYGTTAGFIYDGDGTVFKLSKTGKETVLHSFNGADGSGPTPGLIMDGAGNLYGTTFEGGDLNCNADYGCGVVFKLDKTGKYAVLHRFTGGKDGAFPVWGVDLDPAGNLYSTTSQTLNKSYKCCRGTVFTIDQAADYDSYGLVP